MPYLLLISILFLSLQVQGQRANSIEQLFDAVVRWTTDGTLPQKSETTLYSLETGRVQTTFWGKAYISKVQFKIRDKDRFKSAYHALLSGLFGDYLTQAGWTVALYGTDHFGPSIYRASYTAFRGTDTLCYLFESERKEEGGWNGRLLFFPGHVFFGYSQENPADVFDAVLDWVEKGTPPHNDFSIVNLKFENRKQQLDVMGKQYMYQLSFGISYGDHPHTTQKGYSYYQTLQQLFVDYLTQNEYQVEAVLNKSQVDWRRVLYKACKDNATCFRYYFEAENARSMGYARIYIIK